MPLKKLKCIIQKPNHEKGTLFWSFPWQRLRKKVGPITRYKFYFKLMKSLCIVITAQCQWNRRHSVCCGKMSILSARLFNGHIFTSQLTQFETVDLVWNDLYLGSVLVGIQKAVSLTLYRYVVVKGSKIFTALWDNSVKIGLSSVLRSRQHSISYMGDGFYR